MEYRRTSETKFVKKKINQKNKIKATEKKLKTPLQSVNELSN